MAGGTLEGEEGMMLEEGMGEEGRISDTESGELIREALTMLGRVDGDSAKKWAELPVWVWPRVSVVRWAGGEGGSERSRRQGGLLDRGQSCCWAPGEPDPTSVPWLSDSGTTPGHNDKQ